MKLTQAALRSLIKKPGRHSDGGGLYFRVLGEGKAYFVYRFTVAGREREMSLGPFPEISLGEARDKHAELRKQVKVDKIDPLAAKAAPAAQTTPSFGECCDQYLETHAGSWRNSKHVAQWKRAFSVHAAPIRSKPVDQITTADVLGVLRPIWNETPEVASRLQSRIQSVLEAAQALGHIDPDRANVARWKGHLAKPLPKRQRLTRGHHAAMDYRALPEFMAQLAEIDTTASRALQFLILTASRTSEVLNATVDEISFADSLWRVPAERMKMGVAHDVPLSEEALRLLGDQMGGQGKNRFVFPGRPRAPLSTMAMAMLLRRLGIDATVHGFRSTFRDWAADTGVEFSVAEQCLAHATGNAVTRAYLRSSMVERRRPVMAAWAQFVTGEANDNVVALKGRVRAPIRRA